MSFPVSLLDKGMSCKDWVTIILVIQGLGRFLLKTPTVQYFRFHLLANIMKHYN